MFIKERQNCESEPSYFFCILNIRLWIIDLVPEKGATEHEMVGWHHRLDGHEFEQTPGDGDGQGGLACSSPCKELDPTE